MAVIKSVAVNELTRVCEREEKGREEMGSEENRQVYSRISGNTSM